MRGRRPISRARRTTLDRRRSSSRRPAARRTRTGWVRQAWRPGTACPAGTAGPWCSSTALWRLQQLSFQAAWRSTCLGAVFDILDIGDPVAFSPREAGLFPFTIEARRRASEERLIDPLERVDADDRVNMVLDPAGDHRHYAATDANVELRGPGPERVPGYERGIPDQHLQPAAWIGGPYAAVL